MQQGNYFIFDKIQPCTDSCWVKVIVFPGFVLLTVVLAHHEVDGIDITLVFIRDLALWDNLQKQTDDVLWIDFYGIIIIFEKLNVVYEGY